MSRRLATLFLRSRATAPVLAELAALAVLGAALLAWSDNPAVVAFLLAVLPLAPAVLLAAATASASDEAERTVSRPLPPLRLGHLGLLLGAASLSLLAVALAAPDDNALAPLLRNGAGLAGLALLGARLLGAPLAWAFPVAHLALVGAALAREVRPDRWWLWPHPAAPAGPALAAALLALLLGLALVAARGPRPPRPDAA